MIVEEMAIRNWRGYREPHTFRFGPELNVLGGLNEAGKSTLFEALGRVFFDKHTSKAEEIRLMQPHGSTVGPEASVTFISAGKRYRILKRFLQNPTSELSVERGGRFEVEHQGDASDDQLRELLRGEAPTRASKPEHRGLAQALWYLQKEGGVPEETWNESVTEGLKGLVHLIAHNPQEDDLFGAIEESYLANWTPTGRPAAKGDLGSVEADFAKVDASIADLRGKNSQLDAHRADLERIETAMEENHRNLVSARVDLESTKSALAVAEKLVHEKERLEIEAKRLGGERDRLKESRNRFVQRTKKASDARDGLAETESEFADLQADAQRERAAADAHTRKRTENLEPDLKKIETSLEQLQAVERGRKLLKEEKQLEKDAKRLKDARKAKEAKEKGLAKLAAPTKKEIERYHDLDRKLSAAEAKAEASAIRVRFKFKDTTLRVDSRPPGSGREGDEFVVTSPTVFRIREIGEVHVRGGGKTLEELSKEAGDLRREREDILRRFDAPDEHHLADLHGERISAEEALKNIERELERLQEEVEDPEVELAKVQRGISEEIAKAGEVLASAKDWGGQRIRDEIDEAARKKRALIRAIKDEDEAAQTAEKKYRKASEAASAKGATVSDSRATIRSLELENAEAVKSFGTFENLEAVLGQAEAAYRSSELNLAAALKDYDVRVDRPRKEHQQAQRKVDALEKAECDLVGERRDRWARIEQSTDDGVRGQLDDLEGLLEELRKRREALRQNAEAAKVLRDLVVALRNEQTAAVAGPVVELVSRWLATLTSESYDGLTLDERLVPTAIRSVRYGDEFPIESLSYGTYEQVVVLLRLALAVLLSKDERQLVVLDDRLVNADPVRMRRLCLILEEASKNCQVFLATCNEADYAGAGGKLVRVPIDGVKEEEVPLSRSLTPMESTHFPNDALRVPRTDL